MATDTHTDAADYEALAALLREHAGDDAAFLAAALARWPARQDWIAAVAEALSGGDIEDGAP